MERQKRLRAVFRFYLCVFLGMLLVQAVLLPLLFRALRGAADLIAPQIITAVQAAVCLLFVFIDVWFFVQYPLVYRRLRCTEPIEGRAAAFLISAGSVRGEVRHYIDPVVRLPGREGYYVTYRKYSRSWSGSYVVTVNLQLQEAELIRKDGSAVRIGDAVTVWLLQPVSKPLTVRPDGTVQVAGEPHAHRLRGSVPADLNSETLHIFRGAADIEPD